jgi:glycosyltransferase involved in cell wall biosynthesis
MPDITIITSARNESEGVANLKSYISAIENNTNFNTYFIIVDNNSTDDTLGALQSTFEGHSNKSIYRLEDSTSYCEGIGYAFTKVKTDFVLIFPSDLQHPVEDSIILLNTFEQHCGSHNNFAIFSNRIRLDGSLNRIRGTLYKRVVKFMCPTLLNDPSSPLRAFTFNPDVLPKSRLFLNFDIELQFNLLAAGYKYLEIPSFFVPRRTGKSNFRLDLFAILAALSYVRKLGKSNKYLKS